MEGGDPDYQATDVRGCGGGKLMCETRNENRKSSGDGDDDSTERKSRPRRTKEVAANCVWLYM